MTTASAAPYASAPAPAAAPDPGRLFAAAVARDPGRTAVVAPDRSLTFAELDTASARAAAGLLARGAGRGTRVGIALPRGADLVVALLAVWRAGAAYVPLDPAYPEAHRLRIAREAGLHHVLHELPAPGEEGAADWAAVHPLETAYVIHTSGTTGRPKGVEATRGGVARLMAALAASGTHGPGPATVAWNASTSFDASVQQWTRVCRGDTLVLLDDETRADPERLAATLRAHAVTDLDATPSHWATLHDRLTDRAAHEPPLRLHLGGEQVPAALWQRIAEATARGVLEAVNLYGPTEFTVDATAAPVLGPDPHAGRPLPGIRVYVLDARLRRLPAGETGEVYLAGDRPARGYAGRPAATAERFTADPWQADGSRMYRTGDRGRLRPDGTLELLGRTDRQVKLRGLRIEPGEVEAALAGHPSVAAAAVEPRGETLTAYWLPAPGTGTDPAPLRAHLADRLPAHLVPAAFQAVSPWPLAPGGKLDRAALPTAPPPPHPGTGPDAGPDTGPDEELRTPAERLVAEVWSTVLGRDAVRAGDDFFALGGHSLMALRVVARVRAELGVTLPTKDVYRHPRLRDLAAHVTTLAGPAE
ncbi:non-ribosomal peptide synthetase [Streptomyces sp. NBC_00091]|uniref:non-ribosomal peptide synthetase n=1 Tax=Streptomyces sp. NBC_00091 TaxID=2975648 RepID=UPI0022526444|nr:non-ribosomal peptide synthetase [Streptomyces sp. NBC_00091]MCX5380992.1 non-ribosomal peptide synthetase [Streptomyces sp. NBC_00091]